MTAHGRPDLIVRHGQGLPQDDDVRAVTLPVLEDIRKDVAQSR
ncbi:hypothetical protein [Massilia mucilaginosa]|nr:hypothetical protein [Massilia mucilaginosa]